MSTFFGSNTLVGQSLSFSRLNDHTQTHNIQVRLPWTSDRPVSDTSTWQHNTHKGQTSMPPAGYEPANPAHTLGRVATGIGKCVLYTQDTSVTKSCY